MLGMYHVLTGHLITFIFKTVSQFFSFLFVLDFSLSRHRAHLSKRNPVNALFLYNCKEVMLLPVSVVLLQHNIRLTTLKIYTKI